MTKISLLKASILRMHLAFKHVNTNTVDAVMAELQDWHGKLAARMHLSNLGRQDLSAQIKCSIYHVHLLYLGAMMLLYRRIASQLTQPVPLSKSGKPDIVQDNDGEKLLAYAHQGIVAAKHSSRILGLMLNERGIYKRCWLVMYEPFSFSTPVAEY